MLVAIHHAMPPPGMFAGRGGVTLRRYPPGGRASRRVIGMAGVYDTVASVIQTIEGWFPGSVAYRLNNPGNLMFAGQSGATPHPIVGSDGKTRVFAEFPSVAAGQAALENQISLDAANGLTIAQFTAKYAPAQDSNDPASYAAKIAAATGLSVNDPLWKAGAVGAGGFDTVATAVEDNSGPIDLGTLFYNADPAAVGDAGGAAGISPLVWATLAGLGVLYIVTS